MDREIRKGIRAIYSTQGGVLSDEEVVHLTNILMEQCVQRDLPRSQIWEITIGCAHGPEGSRPWLLYSTHRPRISTILDGGIEFDPTTDRISIEGPYDFFTLGRTWNNIVYLEHQEPSDLLPDRIGPDNWHEYLNACNECGLVIGDKTEYYCERCELGTCPTCSSDLIETDSDDPDEEPFYLCETCNKDFPIP